MIQSAMMFALGIFASGLVWLALSVALVRRAKRLTERRVVARIAVRKAEFDSERDELRAKHAVEMHRVGREVSRILDMATAHRLEADVKERDLNALRAELDARSEELADAEDRLEENRLQLQDLERRTAEAGAELRALQHALKLETRRRAIAEEALDEAAILSDKRKLEIIALRAENDALRIAAGAAAPDEFGQGKLPRVIAAGPEVAVEAPREPVEPTFGGSVVPLPVRGRPAAVDSPEQAAALVAEATRDLQRLAGGAEGALVEDGPRLPAALGPDTSIITDLDTRRLARDGALADVEENAESRFFEALAEIRALKRAASQAGE
jgi:hypothetical protein